jgi:hypothetical protein
MSLTVTVFFIVFCCLLWHREMCLHGRMWSSVLQMEPKIMCQFHTFQQCSTRDSARNAAWLIGIPVLTIRKKPSRSLTPAQPPSITHQRHPKKSSEVKLSQNHQKWRFSPHGNHHWMNPPVNESPDAGRNLQNICASVRSWERKSWSRCKSCRWTWYSI